MNRRKLTAVAFIWVASLIGVAAWASQSGREQAPTIKKGEPHGEIISGADLGFQRIAAPPDRDGKVTGRLMVRIDGQWREVAFPVRLVR